jgi:hypothetical protein
MNQPPNEHRKTLQEIDRLLAEAPDEAARAELLSLRERLDAPEIRDMARALEAAPPRRAQGNLVLEFHDPLVPGLLTATGCVVSAAICLFALVEGFRNPVLNVGGTPLSLWIVAAFAGACSAAFTALSFARSFTIRFDTAGMTSTSNGARWSRLRVGAMSWSSIRALQEHAKEGVLEVRAAGGEVFDIPMRVVNYPILQQHLANMVMLYGERG